MTLGGSDNSVVGFCALASEDLGPNPCSVVYELYKFGQLTHFLPQFPYV